MHHIAYFLALCVALCIGYAVILLLNDINAAIPPSINPCNQDIEQVLRSVDLNNGQFTAHLQHKDHSSSSSFGDSSSDMSMDSPVSSLLSFHFWVWSSIVAFCCTCLETIKMIARIMELSLRFGPLLLAYPIVDLLLGRWRELWYQLLLFQLRAAGASFIKLGQWAATRPDLFADELIDHLSTLHSQAPTHSFKQTQAIVKEALGRPIEEIFKEFEQYPIASGAVAQVYLARLQDDSIVAVKVRHPNVERGIRRDLHILQFFCHLINKIPSLRWLNLEENIRNFSRTMLAQMDLSIEARNLKRFSENFRDWYPQVVFPRPIDPYCNSESVLVETFEKGRPIIDYVAHGSSTRSQVERRVADLGIGLYLKMMLLDNFVHSDLHPGNMLVRILPSPDPENHPRPQIIVLDAGLVTELSPNDRRNFLDLFAAIASGEGRHAADLIINRARSFPYTFERSDQALEEFRTSMDALISQVSSSTLAQVDAGKVLSEVLRLGRVNRVPIDSSFTSLVIGTIVLEGLGRQLNPDLNFVEQAKPYLFLNRDTRDSIVAAQKKLILQYIDKIPYVE